MARIVVSDYGLKSLGLADALQRAGHELVAEPPFEALFIDHDDEPRRHKRVEWAAASGAKVFVYPHGAHPLCGYDGLVKPHPATTAMLVHGPGNKWLQESFGHERPVIDIGWFYCEQKPFEPREVRSVLFAPTHPWVDGVTMLPDDRDRNTMVYEKLLRLDVRLTVRYLGEVAGNGLYRKAGVRFEQGVRDNSVESMDKHDLIVSDNGTFGYMAVARGKPVVMYGQDRPPRDDIGGGTVRSWESYRDRVRYPVDVSDGPLDELVELAGRGHPDVPAWRSEWIGDQLTVDRLGFLDA